MTARTQEPVVLHRYSIKPRHLEQGLELWRREVEIAARHGFTTLRGFVETDAEPKLTWLYSPPSGGDLAQQLAELADDPEQQALAEARQQHVFRNLTIRPVEPELLTRATPESVAGQVVAEKIAIMRRYDITGDFDDFLAIWREIVPVRERYGFGCLFAVSDREQGRFTWAFDFDGDFADFPAAQRDYYHDPQRVRLREVFHFMADYSIHPARQLLL
ncbi:hypothetical protein [Luteococcus peritonei]|uniref:NIPSNAP family protein n=1 Tax=Luteococcus peritonei TaxID=88874 RepID=A0ABW4RUM5_9ACTN